MSSRPAETSCFESVSNYSTTLAVVVKMERRFTGTGGEAVEKCNSCSPVRQRRKCTSDSAPIHWCVCD
ncbi:hypothetical protein F2P81_006134 [Scophthalmus maximus]|uniref:Uncharacterized protein n=1 Tax=Scophthalmus maximus TaxID=52904 RepID=A0A6A4TKN9_SCOMX|nr:hypothetical protein F2P81_006134 [Scophthalmus maximus]